MDDTANKPDHRFRRSELLAAAAAGLFAFALYFYSLPHVITGEDAGELTTAAYTLGIPHPPGYPTWCLLAHPFTWIPFGSVAWRVALSSAVFGALAVSVTALVSYWFTRRVVVALAAAIWFAVDQAMFTQAIIPETYALSALVLTLTFFILFKWDTTRNDVFLYVLALLLGLGQGVHNTLLLVAVIAAGYVVVVDWRVLRRPRLVAGVLFLSAAGFSTFAYLPIRSAADPVPDWGNPETLSNFWAVLTRQQFAFMYSENPRDLWQWLWQTGEIWFTAACCSVGLLFIKDTQKKRLWLLAMALGVLPPLVIFWLQNPLPSPEWDMVMRPFLIPASWLFALFVGGGMRAGMTMKSKYPPILILLFLLVLVFVAVGYHSKRDYRWVDRYARELFAGLPKDAIFFPESDHAAFGMMYLQQVEGLRPDVSVGNFYGYVDVSLLEDAPQELLNFLGERPRRGLEPDYFAHLLTHSKRPVYFSRRPKLTTDAPVDFRQEYLLFRAVPKGTGESLEPSWPEDKLDHGFTFAKMHMVADYTALSIMSELHAKRAEYFLQRSEWEKADQDVTMAQSALWEVATLNNLGTLLARHGQYERATELLDEALKLEPWSTTLQRNLEKVQLRRVESDESDRSDKPDAEPPTAE